MVACAIVATQPSDGTYKPMRNTQTPEPSSQSVANHIPGPLHVWRQSRSKMLSGIVQGNKLSVVDGAAQLRRTSGPGQVCPLYVPGGELQQILNTRV